MHVYMCVSYVFIYVCVHIHIFGITSEAIHSSVKNYEIISFSFTDLYSGFKNNILFPLDRNNCYKKIKNQVAILNILLFSGIKLAYTKAQ